jgi:predicted ATP-grasp superfamily ATP-dependent carboligase
MDLGFNVDSRFASEIFSVANNMLGHAISAKTAKINKKLKMIDLQLKKAAQDQRKSKDEPIETGEGYVLDRNEMLEKLLKNKDSKD